MKTKTKRKPERKLREDFITYALPILENGDMRSTAEIRQHGTTTRFSTVSRWHITA